MKFIADLHIHSKYSRATSPDMDVTTLDRWAALKGIRVMGSGDFTHPLYLAELKTKVEPLGNGLYRMKKSDHNTNFMLTSEVSNIYTQAGRLRKIHAIILAPSFEVVEKLNLRLSRLGKLSSDGRPIFGFSAKDLVKLVLDTSQECVLIPAHAWTPWFSLFGANSGFDSIEECFGEEAKNIFAIETGLSSDPEMNWRLSKLDRITLISNSDAHSPAKIGREANIFECELSYCGIVDAIRKRDRTKFLATIEFFPEEGKYHYDGHRNCNILFSPSETKEHRYICPQCKGRVTVGVMHRVEVLADRAMGYRPANAIPSIHLVPFVEIIAEALNLGVDTAGVSREYERLVAQAGSEFSILLDLSIEELAKFTPPRILEGIKTVREGRVSIRPGYDGVYGQVKIFGQPKDSHPSQPTQTQMSLF